MKKPNDAIDDKKDKTQEKDDLFLDLLKGDSFDYPLTKDYSELRHDLESRLSELKSDRSHWESIWLEVASYISPQSGKYIPKGASKKKGASDKSKILCNTGLTNLRTLSAGLLGGMSSQTKPWFHLSPPPESTEDTEVKVWLSDAVDRMRVAMQNSNIYEQLGMAYNDLGLFGINGLIVYEDEDTVFRGHSLPMGQYYLSADANGEVTALYREYRMTLRQMVDRFGLENVSDTARNAYLDRRGFETEYTICHAIQPNKDFNPEVKGAKARLYIDVYWEMGSDSTKLLQYKGFYEKPFFTPRWGTLSGDVYAECPAMDALPDIKQLQYCQKSKLATMEKYNKPTLVMHDTLKDQAGAFVNNGIIFSPDPDKIRANPIYQTNGDISGLQNEANELIERIEMVFHRPLWLMLNQMDGVQPRNNMEIMERKGEKITQLSPVIQKIQAELLNPLINRIFNIMLRKELFLPLPDALKKGSALKVEYTSELSIAQTSKDTIPIEQMLSFTGNLASYYPEVRNKLDPYMIMDEYGASIGSNPRIMVSTEKAKEIAMQQAQQAQQQQQQEMMLQQGLAMAQGAKTLSETPVGAGTNALQSMMGMV